MKLLPSISPVIMSSVPTFTETWGCQMIAYILNTGLFGIAALLVGQYFHSFSKKDSVLIKGTMGAIGLFATAQFVFITHQIYTDYVTRFSNIESLDDIVMSAPLQLLFIYLTAFTTQCFFASRIWAIAHLKQRFFWTAPVLLLALLQIGAGITQTVLVFKVGKYSILETTAKVTSLQSGATAVCDMLITFILCYILHDAKSGIRRTNTMINKMILFCISRGAVTSLAALLNLIFFVSKPGTFIFMIPLETSSQLYAISVATMLNTREALRANLHADITSLPSSHALSDIAPSRHSQSKQRGLNVQVHTDILTLHDKNYEHEPSLGETA
ncbi:hypothetical protein F5878DRAFT_626001 [Lentinula raphanica]|uniref:DUF6534 domain-containing protein n=1 Tax=Lentinula raphanica TaxID=153919 RepID=A0AA38P4R4_9AGAR|nr:hypothetical protein F5878DRAFT_626001 [Lentinula raphanica]